MKWVCAQNGAREHYAIPRALHQSGRLGVLITEFWANKILRSGIVESFKPLVGRYHPELSNARVVHWGWETILRKLRHQIPNPKSQSRHLLYIEDGRWLSEKVRDYLVQNKIKVTGKIVFSYDTTALELFQWVKEEGGICVLGQMDPGRVEAELVKEEEKRWKDWKINTLEVPEEFHRRREEEWKLADKIIVNSKWSYNALIQQDVSPDKLSIIPLCYEPSSKNTAKLTQASGLRSPVSPSQISPPQVSGFKSPVSPQSPLPLRVLFLGQVILRKGIQYLVEAARLLENESVHFDVVGPIGISDFAVQSAPDNVTFHGRAHRDQARDWYLKSDVFVLPTLSDGFAITQLEAMSYALPVITTPNCGEVVTDGEDGFIVPAYDVKALVGAIMKYIENRGLLRKHSVAAVEKSKMFGLDTLQRDLLDLEEELLNR